MNENLNYDRVIGYNCPIINTFAVTWPIPVVCLGSGPQEANLKIMCHEKRRATPMREIVTSFPMLFFVQIGVVTRLF